MEKEYNPQPKASGEILIELNKIYNENCIETMSRMPDNFVDIVVTSPPYNYHTSKRYPIGRYNGQDDNMNINEYREFIFKVIDDLIRVTNHYVFFNIQRGNGNGATVFEIFGKYKEIIKDVFIWAKTNPPNGGFVDGLVASGHEYIFCFSKGDNSKRSFERYNFTSKDYVKNILIHPVNSEGIVGHNAMFPQWLPDYFIKYFSFENDIIYDPFMGSGTTAISAEKQNRRWIGSEINKDYIELANKRISIFKSQTNLFK